MISPTPQNLVTVVRVDDRGRLPLKRLVGVGKSFAVHFEGEDIYLKAVGA